MMTVKKLSREELLLPGHAACPGCGAMIALRTMLKTLGRRTILVIPACCTSVIQALVPKTSIGVPVLNIAFAASGAAASGVVEALEKLRRKDINVVVWAGDGGTADIGIQALSGAAERKNNIIYICYDNEAYMNTGIQRSGATPYGAWTTTTPIKGKTEFKKDMPMIMAAHGIPYVATASAGFPLDFANKLLKASKLKGLKYIHLLAPCPTGWRYDSKLTVRLGRLAVWTWMWPLFEVEHGVFKLTLKPKPRPVKEFLEPQGRFRRMTPEEIELLQKWVDQRRELLLKMDGARLFPQA